MRMRKFQKKDAKECSKIIFDCINKSKNLTKGAKEHLRKKSTPEALIKKSKQRSYYVYEKEGKILGVGALNKNQIRTMYTYPKLQNKGIGSLILKKLEEMAKKKKIKKLFLYTHPRASTFYIKNGWKIIKKFKDKDMNVIYMEKEI